MTVHHTAAVLDSNHKIPARVRQHQRFHIDDRGWPDLAYHFIVDANGHVYEGRPVTAVFVVDTSGSMLGAKVNSVQRAMTSATGFIDEENSVGVVEFNDTARRRLPVADFDLNQEGRSVALTNQLEPAGGTAMYDGIVLGLSMLAEAAESNPDTKPILIVLTDGETTDGLRFTEVDEMIAGLRIPVYTVGFEADLDELARLSSLVEAASINASEDDVEFKIATLFNAEV